MNNESSNKWNVMDLNFAKIGLWWMPHRMLNRVYFWRGRRNCWARRSGGWIKNYTWAEWDYSRNSIWAAGEKAELYWLLNWFISISLQLRYIDKIHKKVYSTFISLFCRCVVWGWATINFSLFLLKKRFLKLRWGRI